MDRVNPFEPAESCYYFVLLFSIGRFAGPVVLYRYFWPKRRFRELLSCGCLLKDVLPAVAPGCCLYCAIAVGYLVSL